MRLPACALPVLAILFLAMPAGADAAEPLASPPPGPALIDPADLKNAPAPGEQDPLCQLTVYLAEAVEKNPNLAAARAAWESSAARVDQAGALPDPRLMVGVFAEPIETRTGPQRARLGVSQTFPWFGKRGLAAQKADLAAQARKAVADSVRLAVVRRVKDAYYEYAYAVQAEDIVGQNLELLRFLESVVGSRYAAGKAPYADLLRLQVEADRVEDRRRTFKDRQRPLAAALNASMNRPVDASLPPPPAVPVMITSLTDEEILAGVSQNNPRLTAFGREAASAQAGVKLAKKDYYPDFTFGVDYMVTDEARSAGVPGSGDDPVLLTVSVNVPLWRDKRRAAVTENAFREQELVHGRRELEENLLAEARQALFSYRDAGRKIVLYKDSLIPKARQALSVTVEAFQSGEASSTDLVSSEQALLDLNLAHTRALADQALALARLETLFGHEIECQVHGSLMGGSMMDRLQQCLKSANPLAPQTP